jgi:hypothetical protein
MKICLYNTISIRYCLFKFGCNRSVIKGTLHGKGYLFACVLARFGWIFLKLYILDKIHTLYEVWEVGCDQSVPKRNLH